MPCPQGHSVQKGCWVQHPRRSPLYRGRLGQAGYCGALGRVAFRPQWGWCEGDSLHAPVGDWKRCWESAPVSCRDPLIPGWHHLRQLRITKSDSHCGQTEGLRLGKTDLWSSSSDWDPATTPRISECLGKSPTPTPSGCCTTQLPTAPTVRVSRHSEPAWLQGRGLSGDPGLPHQQRTHLSSVDPRFSISFVTSAISSFSR